MNREREERKERKGAREVGEFSALVSKEKTMLVTDDESFWLFWPRLWQKTSG